MKTIQEKITEGRQVTFRVAFNDFVDSEGLPIGVSILVDSQDAEAFDKFGEQEEGNIFAHFDGRNTEY